MKRRIWWLRLESILIIYSMVGWIFVKTFFDFVYYYRTLSFALALGIAGALGGRSAAHHALEVLLHVTIDYKFENKIQFWKCWLWFV